MRKTILLLSVIVALSGCSTGQVVYEAASFVTNFALEDGNTSGATAEPRMVDEGGRYLRILLGTSGVFQQEYETASNRECLRLSEEIALANGSRFKCSKLPAAETFGASGAGKATSVASGAVYKFNSLNANVCRSLSVSTDVLIAFKIACD